MEDGSHEICERLRKPLIYAYIYITNHDYVTKAYMPVTMCTKMAVNLTSFQTAPVSLLLRQQPLFAHGSGLFPGLLASAVGMAWGPSPLLQWNPDLTRSGTVHMIWLAGFQRPQTQADPKSTSGIAGVSKNKILHDLRCTWDPAERSHCPKVLPVPGCDSTQQKTKKKFRFRCRWASAPSPWESLEVGKSGECDRPPT